MTDLIIDKPIKLVVNKGTFKLNSYDELLNDEYVWEYIQDNSGWAGTGGDWRCIAKTIQALYKTEECQNGEKVEEQVSEYDPFISIQILDNEAA